jgi:hypothetical protein
MTRRTAVIHVVTVKLTLRITRFKRGASYPNWIGSDQLRHFKFDGSRLLLSTPALLSGGQSLEYVAIWERIS